MASCGDCCNCIPLPCRGHDTAPPCWTWPGCCPAFFYLRCSKRAASIGVDDQPGVANGLLFEASRRSRSDPGKQHGALRKPAIRCRTLSLPVTGRRHVPGCRKACAYPEAPDGQAAVIGQDQPGRARQRPANRKGSPRRALIRARSWRRDEPDPRPIAVQDLGETRHAREKIPVPRQPKNYAPNPCGNPCSGPMPER